MSAGADVHGDRWARGARHDHAVNVAAEGPPRWLLDLLASELPALAAYPDEAEAAAALARHHGRQPSEVVLLNGAAHGFGLLAEALAPRAPAVVQPQFTEPGRALAAAGRPLLDAVLPEPWRLDPAAVPAGADLVVVGNPTNPTGVLHPAAAIRALLRPGRTVVVDEAFMDFVPGEPESLAGERTEGLVVVRSLTKILAVPGLRIGYLLAEPALAARLRERRQAWAVNGLALAAAAAVPAHAAEIAARAARAQADRAALATALEAVGGLTVHPGAANFLLVRVPGAPDLAHDLRARHHIAVRPAGTFPGLTPEHVRITARGGEADRRLAAAIADCYPRVKSGTGSGAHA